MKYFNQLTEKIDKKELIVGIMGLGYVGLPLAIRFTEEKIKTIGFDTNLKKIDLLNNRISYLQDISDDQINQASPFFSATADFKNIEKCDVIIICVPTPLNKHNEPNLEFIEKAVSQIIPNSKPGQLVSLESTTYPGTTEEIIKPAFEKHGYEVGSNYFIVYSPERQDPGRSDFNTKTIPKICSGITENCLKLGEKLYGTVVDTIVPMSSTQAAEMTKLLENIHRAVNIGLVNEMKMIADKMHLNIHEVIAAASTKPFGFVPYQPGPGLGGHCIPVDPFYLTWKAKELGFHSYFIELAGEINSRMPHYVVEKLVSALNEKQLPANGSKALVLGVAYKKNVDDIRESPALEIIKLLEKKQMQVSYSDPYISHLPLVGESVEINAQKLSNFDVVVLVTDHDLFDYQLIERNSRLIVDTRGRFKPGQHIVQA